MPRLLPGQVPPNIPGHEAEKVQAMWDGMAEQMKDKPHKYYDIFTFDNRSKRSRDPDDGTLVCLQEADEISAAVGLDGLKTNDNGAGGAGGGICRSGQKFCLRCGAVLRLFCRFREEVSLHEEESDQEEEEEVVLGFGLIGFAQETEAEGQAEVENGASTRKYRMVEEDIRSEHGESKESASKPTTKEPKNPSGNERNNCILHHSDLSTLFSGSLANCHLCEILQRCLVALYPDHDLAELASDFRIETCWPRSQAVRRSDRDERPGYRLFFVLVNSKEKKWRWNWTNFYRMQMWPEQEYGRCFATGADGVAGRSTSSPASRDSSRKWLSRCVEDADGKHAACAKSSRGSKLPRRVLNVRDALATGSLKLVCWEDDSSGTIDGNEEFITLSHSWGKKKLPVLTEANLQERMEKGIPMDEMPKTFHDAVTVADWFGITWLWIDCLCIIQDSDDDWKAEAAAMAAYYSGATLTISAAHAKDAADGCFVERQPDDLQTPLIGEEQSSQAWFMSPDVPHQFDWMWEMPAFARAWIHRERQLSRRILHFTDKELVWECCGTENASFASETMPGGAPFTRVFGSSRKFQASDLAHGDLAEIHATWNELCEGFSQRSITYHGDLPTVTSSLAEDFQALLPTDEYVAGLWRSQLPFSLLWYVQNEPLLAEYVAPSWSWMAHEGRLTMRGHLENNWARHDLVVIDEIRVTPQDDRMPFGPIERGSMTLSGILRRVHFEVLGEPPWVILSVYEDAFDDRARRVIGPITDAYSGDQFEMTFDTDCEAVPCEIECYALFVAMQQWYQKGMSDHRNIQCLLLQPLDNDNNTQKLFRRIGTLDLKDLFSLQMRYEMHPSVENNFDKTVRDKDSSDGTRRGFWKSLQLHISHKYNTSVASAKAEDPDFHGTSKDADPRLAYDFDGDVEVLSDMLEADYMDTLSPTTVTIV